ncbi:hypothetical protein AB0B25_10105 [Nocardia sp. NPDC049190]
MSDEVQVLFAAALAVSYGGDWSRPVGPTTPYVPRAALAEHAALST